MSNAAVAVKDEAAPKQGRAAPAASGKQSPAAGIRQIVREQSGGAGGKAGMLVSTATSTLKWLMLYSESDDIRLEAARLALELPHARRKLELQAEEVPMYAMSKPGDRSSRLGHRIRELMAASGDRANEVFDLLEEAEKQAGLPGIPGRRPKIPSEDNGDR